MDAKYKVSIITVCYNSADTIEDTIKSVLRQGREDVQHVIIDGGSSDRTLDIIEEYREQYGSRLFLLSEPDKGIYDAMNKGVHYAEGNMIGILNSDDYLASDDVLDHVIPIFGNNYDMVFGNLKIIDDDGRVIRQWNPGLGDYQKGWIMPHPSLYISRELYHKVGAYDIQYKISADYDLMIRCLKHINQDRLYYLDKDFVHMRVGGASNDGVKSIISGMRQIHSILKKNQVSHPVLVNLLRLIKKFRQYGNR